MLELGNRSVFFGIDILHPSFWQNERPGI